MATKEQSDFFEAIAGNSTGHPMAEAIREALQAESETIKQVNIAHSETLTTQDYKVANALKDQLIEAGVFKRNPSTGPSWLGRFANLFNLNFVGENWLGGLSVAACVMIICTIMVKYSINNSETEIKTDVATTTDAPRANYAQVEPKRAEIQIPQQNDTGSQAPIELKDTPSASYANNKSRDRNLAHTPPAANEESAKPLSNTLPPAIEPDAVAIEDKTSIAENTKGLSPDPEASPDDQNPQLANETEQQSSDEKYAKAENTPSKNSSSIIAGSLSGIASFARFGPSIYDANPERKANDLGDKFKQLDAQVSLVKVNDDEWVLNVSVSNSSKLEAIKEMMVEEGVYQKDIDSNPPYKIRIRRKQ